ncbi:MAG: GHKL domain-containing protein [Lachnospiraceae bacterium]|jgi:hypothetical protein|nr:GHKL domain-containing protein [Lachnospiraceae bacterium]
MICRKLRSDQEPDKNLLFFDLDLISGRLFLSEEWYRVYQISDFKNGDDAQKAMSVMQTENFTFSGLSEQFRNLCQETNCGSAEAWLLAHNRKSYLRTLVQWEKIFDAAKKPVFIVGTANVTACDSPSIMKKSKDQEIAELRKQIEQQKVYLDRAEEYQKELRRYRHDRKNNLISLSGLLESGDIEGARNYVKEFVDILNKHSVIIHTGNPAIDTLITEKLAEAEKAKIEVEQIVGLPQKLNISMKDLCLSVGCCLDNAIEACIKAREASLNPHISLQLIEARGILIFKMENTTASSKLVYEERKPTSKEDKVNHGFGLNNVRSVVDKYHGYFEATIKDHVFVTNFTLPIG